MKTCIGIVLGLVILELLVRRVYTTPFVFEPEVGWVHAPGIARWGREGVGTSYWTEHGIRRSTPVAADAASILVLGDSFVEALQVDDDDVFTTRLEQMLRVHHPRLQVVNAGRAAQSAADFLIVAPHWKRLIRPVWTVIEIRTDDLMADAWNCTGCRHFALDPDNALTVVDYPQTRFAGLRGLLWSARQRSMLLAYTFTRANEYRAVMANEAPLFHAGQKPAVPPKRDYPMEEEIALLANAYDRRLTILLVAPFNPAAPLEATEDEKRVLAACIQHGVSCTTARSAYPSLAAAGIAPAGFSNTAYNTGHLNAEGHRVHAEALYSELMRVGALH